MNFRFFEWYELLGKQCLPVDKIYNVLNCIRLKWQRTAKDSYHISPDKEVELVPVESIFGLIHVVRNDGYFPKIHEACSH